MKQKKLMEIFIIMFIILCNYDIAGSQEPYFTLCGSNQSQTVFKTSEECMQTTKIAYPPAGYDGYITKWLDPTGASLCSFTPRGFQASPAIIQICARQYYYAPNGVLTDFVEYFYPANFSPSLKEGRYCLKIDYANCNTFSCSSVGTAYYECFDLVPPTNSITVGSPNGGEMWQLGGSYSIQWTYTGDPGANIKVELLKSGTVVNVISASTPIGSGGTGSVAWTVPNNLTQAGDYRVRITSTTNGSYTDTSDIDFTLYQATHKKGMPCLLLLLGD